MTKINNTIFNSFPADIQQYVLERLELGYKSVSVEFENGKWDACIGACIKSKYANDFVAYDVCYNDNGEVDFL